MPHETADVAHALLPWTSCIRLGAVWRIEDTKRRVARETVERLRQEIDSGRAAAKAAHGGRPRVVIALERAETPLVNSLSWARVLVLVRLPLTWRGLSL